MEGFYHVPVPPGGKSDVNYATQLSVKQHTVSREKNMY